MQPIEDTQREAYAFIPLSNNADVLSIQREIKSQLDDERIVWQAAPTLHITLAFAKLISDRAIEAMGNSITNQVVTIRPKVDEPLAYFDTPDGKALHIAIGHNEELDVLQGSVYSAFSDEGDDLSEFSIPDNWNPHITLAYIPDDIDITPIFNRYEYQDFQIESAKVIIARDDYDPVLLLTAPQTKLSELDDTHSHEDNLMSETTKFVFEQVSAFEGSFPDIAHRPDFQIDDGDDSPCFFTLPLGEVGNVSGNNNLYDEAFYQELVTIVNEGDTPVRGIVGHPNPENVAYETTLPNIEWVGATLADDGMVWGKAYVYAEETKIRSDVRRAAKRNLKVATSLRGTAVMEGNRATKPSDLWIDYVDPYRAGVKAAIATPAVMSEMQTPNSDDGALSEEPIIQTTEQEELNIMPETKVDANVIQLQEQINTLNTFKEQFATLAEMVDSTEVVKTVRELLRQNTEMKPFQEIVESVRTELGTQDVVEAIQELKADRNKAVAESLGFTVKNLVETKVEFEGARPMIARMIGLNFDEPQKSRLHHETADAIAEQIDGLLADDYIQETIKNQVLATSGGHVFIGEQNGQATKFEDTPEARANARATFGF